MAMHRSRSPKHIQALVSHQGCQQAQHSWAQASRGDCLYWLHELGQGLLHVLAQAMLQMSCTSRRQGCSRLCGSAQFLTPSLEGLRSMPASGSPQSTKSSTCSEPPLHLIVHGAMMTKDPHSHPVRAPCPCLPSRNPGASIFSLAACTLSRLTVFRCMAGKVYGLR